MEWTEELNALLNQCVFASGYDFEASSKLFCEQATKLRLWTEAGALSLTANQCQDQWMILNPTEEEYEEEEDDVKDTPEKYSSEECQQLQETSPAEAPSGPNLTDIEPVEHERDDTLGVGPRLELSLTEAELDQLLSTLPPGPEDADISESADSKDCHRNPGNTCSEMQWVLAFLTDPNAVACVDADAKNLMSSPEKNDDDNYQVFLQGLHDANLIVQDQPVTTRTKLAPITQQESTARTNENGTDADESDSDSDGSAEEWELTRQAMKRTLQLR